MNPTGAAVASSLALTSDVDRCPASQVNLLLTMVMITAGHTSAADLRSLFACRHNRMWWSQTGSNRRPQACKASALPTELWPRKKAVVVGPGRFELPTPRLSSVCSNQLSYGPSPAAPAHTGSCRTGLAITSPLSCFQAARGSRKRNEDGDETAICFCCDVRSRSEDQEQSVQLLGSSRSEVRLHTLEHP